MYKGHNSFRTTLGALLCTLVISTMSLASVIGPAATSTHGVMVHIPVQSQNMMV